MMKKLLCIALAALMLLAFGACKVDTPTPSTDDTQSTATVDPAEYRVDGLAGLANCLQAAEYISGDPVEMEASFIGATLGRRYAFTYNSSAVTVEIYEFDSADHETLLGVDERGTFTVLGTEEVEAYRSGPFLLVYSDSSDKAENTARRDAVVDLFTRFGALEVAVVED